MSEPATIAVCRVCTSRFAVHPPNLPPSGGCASFHDYPARGWQALEFTCGSCWAVRRSTWTCPHCGDASYELALQCRGCGRAKSGLPPYQPDWDLIWKEERERKREAEALLAEAIDEFGAEAVTGSEARPAQVTPPYRFGEGRAHRRSLD